MAWALTKIYVLVIFIHIFDSLEHVDTHWVCALSPLSGFVETSPWIVHLKFAIEMTFSVSGIQSLLRLSPNTTHVKLNQKPVRHCFSWLQQTHMEITKIAAECKALTEFTCWIYGWAQKSLFFLLFSQDMNNLWIYLYLLEQSSYKRAKQCVCVCVCTCCFRPCVWGSKTFQPFFF